MIAGANALLRMKESTRPSATRILVDPFAARLAEDHWAVQAIRYARFALPPLWRAIDELQTAHCVRHRSLDELVLRAVREGFRQLVIVGAGYDMRASRFADSLASVRTYELDLPGTGARKQRLCASLDDAHGRVEYARVDLSSQSVLTALATTSFDRSAPTCFVLEGLIHYLSPERLHALMAEIASGGGPRRVLLSYIRSEVYARAHTPLRWLVRALGEIPRLHFGPDELAQLAARHGFARTQRWTFDEQLAAFAPQGRVRRVASTQDVAQLD